MEEEVAGGQKNVVKPNHTVTNYSCLTTVVANKEYFTYAKI